MKKYFETKIEEDAESNDLLVVIPSNIIESLDWYEGDELEFHVLDSSKLIVINKSSLKDNEE